ncbi:MAG: hypothetical protein ACC726_00465 [Chloroflexota bacterium]
MKTPLNVNACSVGPAWIPDLRAHPDTTVEFGTETVKTPIPIAEVRP